jgi:hypothetical protein
MTEPLFHVIAAGRPAAGFEAAAVAQQLVAQLRLSAAQAERLLNGNPVVAKRGVARDIAEIYCSRLGALGLEVRIEQAPPAAAEPSHQPTPAVATTADPTPRWLNLIDLLHGVAMPLPKIRSARHGAAIASIGLQALGIALAYACLVALAAAALIGYTASFYYLLAAPPLLFSIPVFVVPWLLLLALNALLLRPLLPLVRDPSHAPALHAQQQPQLFHWLAQLCELVAVPMPLAVSLSTQVAHAVQVIDEPGALRHAEYQLVLSLPLLEVAAVRDNSARTAATLAVQARASALRCHWLLQTMHDRCRACLERRDWLGARLARIERSSGVVARLLLALHERLLQPIVDRLARLQGAMSRHVTLETDRVYTRLAGSAAFIDNLLLQHKLEQAWRDATALNSDARADAGLAANLPALIRHYYDHFDSDAAARLRKQWSQAAGRSPNTEQPTAAERVEAARAQDAAGVLPVFDTNTGQLLAQHGEALALQVTATFYRDSGLVVEPARLLSTETLTFAANEDLLRREQTAQYFNNWFRPFRFWRLADHALIDTLTIGDAVQQLNVCVNEIRRLTPDRARLLNEYERLQNQILDLSTGQQVLAQAKPYAFRYAQHENAALQPLLEERQQQLAKVVEQLTTQETIMGGRIGLGLRLCGGARRDIERLRRALALASGLEPRLYRLSVDAHVLEQLVQRRDEQRETCYAAAIRRLEEKIDDATTLLCERLKDMPHLADARYPTVADFIAARLGDRRTDPDVSTTLERSRVLLQSLHALNESLSASAANFGTTAEEAYSIESIRLVAAP